MDIFNVILQCSIGEGRGQQRKATKEEEGGEEELRVKNMFFLHPNVANQLPDTSSIKGDEESVA